MDCDGNLRTLKNNRIIIVHIIGITLVNIPCLDKVLPIRRKIFFTIQGELLKHESYSYKTGQISVFEEQCKRKFCFRKGERVGGCFERLFVVPDSYSCSIRYNRVRSYIYQYMTFISYQKRNIASTIFQKIFGK